jgi:plastocyanin
MLALAVSATLLAVVVAAIPFSARRDPVAVKVMVHCPTATQSSFVSPAQVSIAVGDTIQWRMAGPVATDTLFITLKEPSQVWPFAGPLPKGRNSAQSGPSLRKGTYGYNVSLECRITKGPSETIVIDPEVKIE